MANQRKNYGSGYKLDTVMPISNLSVMKHTEDCGTQSTMSISPKPKGLAISRTTRRRGQIRWVSNGQVKLDFGRGSKTYSINDFHRLYRCL